MGTEPRDGPVNGLSVDPEGYIRTSVRLFGLLISSFARNATHEIERRRANNVPLREMDFPGPIVSMKEFAQLAYHLTANWNKRRSFKAYLYWTARKPFNCLEKSTYRELSRLAITR
ncbi:MAG: hypothetical protein ACYS1A_20550 [Planctomycetota bacterium]|jgi:hypothetical protein